MKNIRKKVADAPRSAGLYRSMDKQTRLSACVPKPGDIVSVSESMVRGYKVRVVQRAVSAEEVASRRAEIARVIARSLQAGTGR